MLRTVFEKMAAEPYGRVLLSPSTIIRRATRPDTVRTASELMGKLEPDDYVRFLREYYECGLTRFGEDWVYGDIVTVLLSAAALCQPSNYLEIGVRRGRSLAAVVSAAPEVKAFAFDMWIADYANMPNPGAEFVQAEMNRLGYSRPITIINGNSHETLPRFFAERPGLELDLITVDGDHTERGALQDLRDVLPHLALGGVIVFDDIVHPSHPYLLKVWQQALEEDGGIRSALFTELGYGVAVGVRNNAPVAGNGKSPVSSKVKKLLKEVPARVQRKLKGADRLK